MKKITLQKTMYRQPDGTISFNEFNGAIINGVNIGENTPGTGSNVLKYAIKQGYKWAIKCRAKQQAIWDDATGKYGSNRERRNKAKLQELHARTYNPEEYRKCQIAVLGEPNKSVILTATAEVANDNYGRREAVRRAFEWKFNPYRAAAGTYTVETKALYSGEPITVTITVCE